jgi:hypothetical protein
VRPLPLAVTEPPEVRAPREDLQGVRAELTKAQGDLDTARELQASGKARSGENRAALAQASGARALEPDAPLIKRVMADQALMLTRDARVDACETTVQALRARLDVAAEQFRVAHNKWIAELRADCEGRYRLAQASFAQDCWSIAAEAKGLRADHVLHSLSASALVWGGRNMLTAINRPSALDTEFAQLVQSWTNVAQLED